MSKCILCNSNIILPYGEDRFGEVFCKDCYEKYNCLHCNRMNIEILCDKNNNIIDVLIKKMYGLTVARDSTLISLFEPGYKFKLYCKECWDTQDMYIEDDILVPWTAIQYWMSYKNDALKNNNNLGFIRTEVDKSGNEYAVDVNDKLKSNDGLFLNNNVNPYCGFWIYDKLEFNRFVNSHYYDIANIEGYKIREKSAIGLHGIHSCWYNNTIIPLINNKVVQACKIYHLSNNYTNNKSILVSDIC